jgi:quercetin dioxygenase-like cupin family protein
MMSQVGQVECLFMHFAGKYENSALISHPVYENHSQCYSYAPLVDHRSGSVHTGLSMNQLAAQGTLSEHVHSFEEGFYILEGHALVSINGQAYLLGPGDFGALKVGTAHAWRNAGSSPVRWLQMAAPQPRPQGRERDTFFPKNGRLPTEGKPLDTSHLNGKLLGHFDASQIPPVEQRPAALVGSKGVYLNWLIDEKFGARHHRMLFVEYQPGAGIPPHDHTFEESYFILSGEIEGVMDGERRFAKAGDVLWTGVGCVHSFTNVSNQPVRWLETFAPQPPAENVFRFSAEWEQRGKELEG